MPVDSQRRMEQHAGDPARLWIMTRRPTDVEDVSYHFSVQKDLRNVSQDLLTPWSCQGTNFFVDVCSGADHPLSTAIRALGFPALPVDNLVGDRMDILNDQSYEQFLRLCGCITLLC